MTAIANPHARIAYRPPEGAAVEFARGFADKFHHFKEEHVLFVRLAQERRGEVDAQLDALRHQHERGRELVAGIGRALEGNAAQDASKTAELLENMAAYASLLRHHIHIEDHVFYPMARKTRGGDAMDRLATEFVKERERHGGDAFERQHKLVVDMGSILTHLH